MAQTKNWERLGFEDSKHRRESYIDFRERKNRLVVFHFLKPRQGHLALSFLLVRRLGAEELPENGDQNALTGYLEFHSI